MAKISSIVRDTAGRLTFWVEGDYSVTVSRDAAGKPLFLRAKRIGENDEVVEFQYSAAGAFSGQKGDFDSALMFEIQRSAAMGGAVPVGAAVNHLTGRIEISVAGRRYPVAHSTRVALFGDSMTDTYEAVVNPTALSYDPATGILSVTSANHCMAVGWSVGFWNRNYPVLQDLAFFQIITTDASGFTINIGAGLSGVPSGSLPISGGVYFHFIAFASSEGWPAWLNMISGQRFDIVYNYAQSGDKTSDCLRRLPSLLDANVDEVWMQMPGINDGSPDAGHSVDEETTVANQQSIINQILNTGKRLILLNMTPVRSGEARATQACMQRAIRINKRLAAYCKGRANVRLVNAYRTVVNPTDPTGLAKTALIRSADNIHYAQNGGFLVAKAVWNAIKYDYLSDDCALPESTIDCFQTSAVTLSAMSRSNGVVTGTATGHGFYPGERVKVSGGTSEFLNLWANVTCTANTVSFQSPGSDGGITGTARVGRNANLFDNPLLVSASGGTLVPGTGSFDGTSVAANRLRLTLSGSPLLVQARVVARADGRGNDQSIVISAAASGDTVLWECDYALQNSGGGVGNWPSLSLAGRTYSAECELNLSGVAGSNIRELRWNVVAVVDGLTYQAWGSMGYANGTCLQADPGVPLHMKTKPFVMPTGVVSSFKFSGAISFSASGTALTALVGAINFNEIE